MHKSLLTIALLSILTTAAQAAENPFDRRFDAYPDTVVLDDVSIAALTGSDEDASRAIDQFRRGDGSLNMRRVTAAAVPQIDIASSQEIAIARRQAALGAKSWILPITDVSSEVAGEILLSSKNWANRTSSTGEQGKLQVCSSFSSTPDGSKPACVRLTNVDRASSLNYPKAINLDAVRAAAGPDRQLGKIRTANVVYAVAGYPVSTKPAIVQGRSTVDMQVTHGMLIDTLTGSVIMRFNLDHAAPAGSTPWIKY